MLEDRQIVLGKIVEIANEKNKKGITVIASMSNVAASGGYYLSTVADKVFANDFTITGSIGVFAMVPNITEFSKRIGISRPKVSILSATEEVLESMPSSKEAKELTERASKEGVEAEVFGPMAFDNSVSEKAAQIKGIKNAVAGKTDILLVPNVESGNALVKMMIYFMGACAAGVVIGGKVPVVITSRADDTQARLASIAAAVVAL